MGAIFSSTADSPMPATRSTRRAKRRSPANFSRRDCTRFSNIGFISRGGPGNSAIAQPSCSRYRPGAVPFGLGKTSAPSITIACREFLSGIVTPKLWNRARISLSTFSSSSNLRPKARATTLRVMSSSVGPSPPVVMTTRERFTASLISSSRRASSSPTIVLSFTSMPTRFSLSVSQRLLVSVRSGASSSEPMAMISAASMSHDYYHRGHRGRNVTEAAGTSICLESGLTTDRAGGSPLLNGISIILFLSILLRVPYSQPSSKGPVPKQSYYIVALPGDGIGPEVLSCALRVLNVASQLFRIDFRIEEIPGGGHYYVEHETEWPEGSFEKCEAADAILLGAVGHEVEGKPVFTKPGKPYPEPQLAGFAQVILNRQKLDLYANVRPMKLYRGVKHKFHGELVQVWDPSKEH